MCCAPYGRGALSSFGGLLGAAALMLSACQDANSPTVSSPQSPNDAAVSFAATPGQGLGRVIPGAYIVVFKSSLPAAAADARALVAQHGGTLRFTYTSAIEGFAADLPAQALDALRRNPNVAYIEPDQVVQVSDVESNASWGLDRVDQRGLPLSNTYTYASTGLGVHAYIIDTGILTAHSDFGGRASVGVDVLGGTGQDCNGHGTHVSGTVGGTTYGVAKAVRLYAVRVLDCGGSGTYSGVIAGVDWVTAHRQLPAVANMSLGGGKSRALNDAVTGSIKSGLTYAVAAGNNGGDACDLSPASTPAALTVAASDQTDHNASFSSMGPCVDLFAPGVGVMSDWNTGSTATKVLSGTSMASPHVAGAAALYLQGNPAASPAAVAAALVGRATSGALDITLNCGKMPRGWCKNVLNVPNLLLYMGGL
jgi:subtilisin family serine protease